MSDGHDPLRTSLGAYLLGALDPADRAEIETHLADCPPCREDLASLAGLPGLLGRLTLAEAVATASPAETADLPGQQLLNRALTELRRRRHSQRRRWLAGAAAAVLIAAVAAVTGTSQSHAPAGTAGGQVIAATDPTTRVHATATLHGEPAGTEITLRLSGVTPGLHCQLIAVAADGRREVASSWRATYHGQADVTGTTALPVAELASLQVVTTDGTRLLTLPAHR